VTRGIHGTAALTLIMFVSVSGSVNAAATRQHGAHVHGVAEINIVIEGAKAVVEIRAPAEGIIGFEHEAKSESDKKKRDAALERLQKYKEQMVVFDAKFSCTFSPMKTMIVEEKTAAAKDEPGKVSRGQKEQKKIGEHREVHGTFTAACAQPLTGSRVRFGVTKAFPRIQEIKVQVLSDSGQSGATIKKDKGEVRL